MLGFLFAASRKGSVATPFDRNLRLERGKVMVYYYLDSFMCGFCLSSYPTLNSGSIPGPAAESQLELEWMSIRWVDPYPVGLDGTIALIAAYLHMQ